MVKTKDLDVEISDYLFFIDTVSTEYEMIKTNTVNNYNIEAGGNNTIRTRCKTIN